MNRYITTLTISVVLLSLSGMISIREFESAQHAQTRATPIPTPGAEIDNISRPTSDPFTGDLARFDRENRAENLQIDRVMDILEITEGKTVADIGAGGGWFSVIAARRVGDSGRVLAVDINPESKTFIDRRSEREKLTNIETIVSSPADPSLPVNSVDAVLILNTYHEFAEPVILLKNLKKSLRKAALIGIIDRDGSGDDHGIDHQKVIDEAKRAGLLFKEKHDFVSAGGMDYFLVFEFNEN